MNKFEQYLRTLVPELGDIEVITGSTFDMVIPILHKVLAGQEADPGDHWLTTALSGVYCSTLPGEKTKIIIAQEITPYVTENELRALTLHEVGHIRNGDFVNCEGNLEYLNYNEKEIAADRFAIKHGCTANDMWNGIKKVTTHGIRNFVAWKKIIGNIDIPSDLVTQVIANIDTDIQEKEVERYTALFA